MSFPPHFAVASHNGPSVTFSIVPIGQASINSNQWYFYAEGIRSSDFLDIIKLLTTLPNNFTVVVCLIESIDDAHYFLENGRSILEHCTYEERVDMFTDKSHPHAPDPIKPSEPLPPGHPDSFSMSDLQNLLDSTKEVKP